MEHKFTKTIKEILINLYGDKAEEVFEKSFLIQYLNRKTKSANSGSKSRGYFANHYALYVLVEDYINKSFNTKEKDYRDYDGAIYTTLLNRIRELPFGAKLQNHALNSRMNEEFKKFFPEIPYQPILRDLKTKRYWINENLLIIQISDKTIVNIANSIIAIVDAYVSAKISAFDEFIKYCNSLSEVTNSDSQQAIEFIMKQIQPNVDARIFEIVSYSILKFYYSEKLIYWGWSLEEIKQENLKLYKTGRTNANDGGIDFVMKPLGRFFQVTETLDIKKYLLDIDKIQKYPISFVIKTEMNENDILNYLEKNAKEMYSINTIVRRYMECIEEVINIPKLHSILEQLLAQEKLKEILEEILIQSRLEFNYDD